MIESIAKKDNIKDCKPPIKFVHPDLIEGIAYGMLVGKHKYDAWNYIAGHDIQDLVDSTIRHLLLRRQGEKFDKNATDILADVYGNKAPKVDHLWLAGCNLNMMLAQERAGTSKNSWPEILKIGEIYDPFTKNNKGTY